MLGEAEISNPFKELLNFKFKDNTLDYYAKIWRLHSSFEGSVQQKQLLNKFYRESLISAVHKYCNRNAPNLEKDHFHLADYHEHCVATPVEIKPDFERLKSSASKKQGHFYAYLKVNDISLDPIEITMNFMELLLSIKDGYRPNKHDKGAVILLEELLEKILSIANQNNTIWIFHADRRIKLVNEGDEYYEISGIK